MSWLNRACLALSLMICINSMAIMAVPDLKTVRFQDAFKLYWDPDHAGISEDGNSVQLKLEYNGGAAFESSGKYLYGYFSIKMKLVPGNSAGTVTSFYVISDDENGKHDEVDFEFLGNTSGQPYILQTNVFANGKGEREQRIYLWFDPAEDFHTYSILWNHVQILMMVDGVPSRVFKNLKSKGIDYPDSQRMGLYSSIFDGSEWATEGGLIHMDWSHAPFLATYTDFVIDACADDGGTCTSNYNSNWWEGSEYTTLSAKQEQHIRNVRAKYLHYDYCTDKTRNSSPPVECAYNEY